MRRRRPQASQRGFAMLVVIIVAALVALLAGSLRQLVGSDLAQVGMARRAFEARNTAEGGVAEVLNDLNFVTLYPSLNSATMETPYPTGASPFVRDGRTYSANVRLLRVGPPTESSLDQTRVITYEVRAEASVANQGAQAEVVAEVLRTIAYPKGWTPEERHYR